MELSLILFLFLGLILSVFLNNYLHTTFNLNKMYDPVTKRSSHTKNATRSGGLALFLTFCIIYGVGKALGLIELNLYALLAFCFISLVGVADDLFTIKYREKLIVQIFAGIVLFQSEIYINNFYGILGIHEIPYLVSAIVTVFIFVIIVNSLNLIDGIDGLAGLICVKFFLIGGIIIELSSKGMGPIFSSLIGALIGFLIYNFSPKKKVFLGDSGSLLLGSIMAFFIFYILDDRNSIFTDNIISRALLVVSLAIYPLTDTLRAFIIRSYRKQSPFVADRVHLHHKLIDSKGMSHWQATLTILLISISVISLGFILSIFFNLTLVILLLLLYMVGVFYLIFN